MYTNVLLLTFICTAMKLMGPRYIMVHILRENELEHIVDSSFDSKQLPATGPVIYDYPCLSEERLNVTIWSNLCNSMSFTWYVKFCYYMYLFL